MVNEELLKEKEQLTLSYEVLCLIAWLAEHSEDRLKPIIKDALISGLKRKINLDPTSTNNIKISDELRQSVLDFFGILEALLIESVNELTEQNAREKKLMTAINQFDPDECDTALLRSSIDQTAAFDDEKNTTTNLKEQLFEELLRRWHPHNKKTVN